MGGLHHCIVACAHLGNDTGRRTVTMTTLLLTLVVQRSLKHRFTVDFLVFCSLCVWKDICRWWSGLKQMNVSLCYQWRDKPNMWTGYCRVSSGRPSLCWGSVCRVSSGRPTVCVWRECLQGRIGINPGCSKTKKFGQHRSHLIMAAGYATCILIPPWYTFKINTLVLKLHGPMAFEICPLFR